MASVADSFGDYGRNGSLAPSQRAARAVNHVIAWVIAVVLLLMAALAGYALWDANQVLKGTDYSQYEPGLGFADLRKLNPDVVAWITVDNTGIDHPVVQGEDNFEYLDKDAKGNDGASGSIFLDSECDPDFEETYEVLYGHHMQAGKMFGDLDKFLDEGFFNANQRAILYLPSETLSLQVCAVVKADAYDGVHAVAEALKEAGLGVDADPTEVAEKLPKAMLKITVDGLTGKLSWNDKGQVQKDPTAYVITDGKYVLA